MKKHLLVFYFSLYVLCMWFILEHEEPLTRFLEKFVECSKNRLKYL